MENLLKILTFFVTFLIPIIQTVLQIWEFFINKKNSNTLNIGNTYHYDNFIYYEDKSISKNSSIFSQNIEYIRKTIFQSYPKIIVGLFIFNVFTNWFSLPNDSLLKGNLTNYNFWIEGITPLFSPIIHILADSFITTVLPIIALIISFLVVLLLKNILYFKISNIFMISYFSITIFCYFQLYNQFMNFDPTTISIIINFLNTTIDYSYLVTLIALIIIMGFIIISQVLVNIIFETNETKNNLKLLKNFVPRLTFYFILLLIPNLLSFFINCYKK
ncbi:hypothetical protein [Streptococcus porcinus]|uniref:Uncharacterized protein n=1 Tax=Streptococcus porcinus TaxID=1340 RepID=A0A7V9WSE9_STRPO|nr:hypothetical protein [Streptococcus porcinus]MBA2796242.1 hypothetical protein [Streptococcus porcinus]